MGTRMPILLPSDAHRDALQWLLEVDLRSSKPTLYHEKMRSAGISFLASLYAARSWAMKCWNHGEAELSAVRDP